MRRTLVVAAVLAAAVAPAAVAPAAAQSFDADAVCESGDRNAVVAVLAATGDRLGRSPRLYAGTRLRILLCDAGEAKSRTGGVWNLSRVRGFTGYEYRAESVLVAVTDETDRVVVDADAVNRNSSVQALTVRVRRAPAAASNLSVDEIPFGTPEAAESYETREDAYLGTLDDLNATADELNETASTLGDATSVSEAASVLERVEENKSRVTAAGNLSATRRALEAALYDAAWSTRSGTALDAIRAVRSRSAATDSRLDAALRRYVEAMRDRRAAAQSAVLVDVAIGLVPGFAVGAVAAAAFVRRRKKRVSFDRKYTHVEFERSVLAWPALAALAVLAATVAAAYLLVPQLSGVILP